MYTSLHQATEHTYNTFLSTDTNKQINIEHETREGRWGFVNNKELSGPDARVCEVRGLQKIPDQAAA